MCAVNCKFSSMRETDSQQLHFNPDFLFYRHVLMVTLLVLFRIFKYKLFHGILNGNTRIHFNNKHFLIPILKNNDFHRYIPNMCFWTLNPHQFLLITNTDTNTKATKVNKIATMIVSPVTELLSFDL